MIFETVARVSELYAALPARQGPRQLLIPPTTQERCWTRCMTWRSSSRATPRRPRSSSRLPAPAFVHARRQQLRQDLIKVVVKLALLYKHQQFNADETGGPAQPSRPLTRRRDVQSASVQVQDDGADHDQLPRRGVHVRLRVPDRPLRRVQGACAGCGVGRTAARRISCRS